MTCGRWKIAGAVAAVAFCVGCGSEQPAVNVENGGEQQTVKHDGRTPQQIVETFLGAVKAGDDRTAEGLLTKTALKETSARELRVAPPGSNTAQFVVQGVETIGDGEGAHVLSTWTEGEGEDQYSDDYIWVLRNDPEGWRIAGMITKPFEDLAPVALDFEDPDHMLQQQEIVEQEAIRRAQQTAIQMQPPAGGQTPVGTEAPGDQTQFSDPNSGVLQANAPGTPGSRPPLQR